MSTKNLLKGKFTNVCLLFGSWWVTDKENPIKMYKNSVLVTLPLRNSKDLDRIKLMDPDPYQSGLVLQNEHWTTP
jgi:hypothetical protein